MRLDGARARGLQPRRVERKRIFVSYRRSDAAGHAGRLHDHLTRLLGTRLFMDVSDIAPGEVFSAALARELESCGAVLVVIGSQWAASFAARRDGVDYVHEEVRQALALEGVAVVPVLVEGASMPNGADLPEDLRPLTQRQAVGLRDDRWDDDVAHLARWLRSILKLRPVARWVAAAIAVVALAVTVGIRLAPGPQSTPTPEVIPPPPRAETAQPPAESAAFDRAAAYEVAIAAARRAVHDCAADPPLKGECPVLLKIVARGTVSDLYFDTGDCEFKYTLFGDCLLAKLKSTRFEPFGNVDWAELSVLVERDGEGGVLIAPGE